MTKKMDNTIVVYQDTSANLTLENKKILTREEIKKNVMNFIVKNKGIQSREDANYYEAYVNHIVDDQLMHCNMNINTLSNESILIKDILIGDKITEIKDNFNPENTSSNVIVKNNAIFDAYIDYDGVYGEKAFQVIFDYHSIESILSSIHQNSLTTIPSQELIISLAKNISLGEKTLYGGVTEEQIAIVANKLEDHSYFTSQYHDEKDITSKADFIKLIKKFKRENLKKENENLYMEDEEKALELLEDYARLKNKGKVSIVDTASKDLDSYSVSSLKLLFADKLINGQNPVDIWIKSKKKRTFKGKGFDPIMTREGILNTFKGFKYKSTKSEKIYMFKDFVYNIICSKQLEMFYFVWTFLAQMIQKPHEKMGTAIVLLGKKGAGKSFFVKTIGRLLGDYFMLSAEPKYLLNPFNEHLEKIILFYANEVTFTTGKVRIAKLKNLITEQENSSELKRGKTYRSTNYTRIIIDSNDDHVVANTTDERRFGFPKVSSEMIGNIDYFNELDATRDNEFYEGLMEDLLNFDYSKYEHYLRVPPKNEVSVSQTIETINPIEHWWKDCLEKGEIVHAPYRVEYDGKLTVTNENLFLSFRTFCKVGNYTSQLNSATFGKEFKKLFLSKLDVGRETKITIDGKRCNAKVYEERDKFIEEFNLSNHIKIESTETEWNEYIA